MLSVLLFSLRRKIITIFDKDQIFFIKITLLNICIIHECSQTMANHIMLDFEYIFICQVGYNNPDGL